MRRQRHKWINPFTFLSFKYFIFTTEKTVKLLEILSVIGNLLAFAESDVGKGHLALGWGDYQTTKKEKVFFPQAAIKFAGF